MDRILKEYKVMNRFVFLLGFLLMALMTVTLQAQKMNAGGLYELKITSDTNYR